MILAIIGSRDFSDFELLELTVNGIEDVSEIISGGAKGTDSLARDYANKYHIKIIEYIPDWKKHGLAAGYKRNVDIINYCDAAIAFWNGTSNGTRHGIELAVKQRKCLKIVSYAGPF
jgi:hypothetical protein